MTLVQDNSVQAINTALLSIKRDVSALTATTAGTTAGLEPGKTYNINISGNAETATTAKTARTATNANHAETAETATKMSNALTVNGKTYDGSSAVDAGVQTVANGGTGATNAADGFNTLADGVRDSSTPGDNEKMLLKPTGAWYKTTCLDFWNYIKGKISSVLGLTANDYGGTANRAKNMYSQSLDLSSLDKTKFYPLVCYSGIDFAEVAICSQSGMGSMEYNQNRIHFDISTQGWSDTPPTLNIREYACYQNNEITIGCIGRGVHNGAWAIWLRGGIIYQCFTRNCDLSLHTSDYTYGDEVYTVGTNYYGGSNTNVEVMFTPQSTITDGSYSSRPITASNKLRIPIGAPSSLEDGCIWIER